MLVTSPQRPSVDVRDVSAAGHSQFLNREQALIKGLFVLPAVFFISRNLISSPLNIA